MLCFDQTYVKDRNFLTENFHYLVVKFSIHLNRRVFEMKNDQTNTTYETTDARSKKNCNREPPYNGKYRKKKKKLLGCASGVGWDWGVYQFYSQETSHIILIELRFTYICLVRKGITKKRLYNFEPLKPHFYIVKLGFTGVHIIFLISAQKHRLWVLVRTASARRF